MKKTVIVLLASLFLFGSESLVFAEQKSGQGTKEEARAMVEKAAEWFQKYGREKTLAEIQRGGTEKKGAFKDRDLYIFAIDFNGVIAAHGANPKLIGKNLYNMQDADGRYLVRGMIETARKGSGWFYYKSWSNPITKNIEDKMTYVLKIDNTLWIGCGVYGKDAQPVVEKRIGVLMFSEQTRYNDSLKGIKDQLKNDGYGEAATTYTIENAQGSYVKTDEIAKRFATANLDLIITFGTNATSAAKQAISDVPIVFSVVYDPVAAGIAKSLKSSGNNITGEISRIPMSKFMNMLKEFAPVKKMAVLYTPGEKYTERILNELQGLQTSSQIKIVAVPLIKKEEVPKILQEVVYSSDAIFLAGSSIVTAEVSVIVDMANKANVITTTNLDDLVEKGVLLGVSPNSYQEGRLAGKKAVKILNGAKPSSISIESLSTFDIIINMKSAKAGKFNIPPEFMKKVSKTIE